MKKFVTVSDVLIRSSNQAVLRNIAMSVCLRSFAVPNIKGPSSEVASPGHPETPCYSRIITSSFDFPVLRL